MFPNQIARQPNIPDGLGKTRWATPNRCLEDGFSMDKKLHTILNVRVHPKASRNQVGGLEEGALQVRVTAPATKGKANAGMISLLAETLGVSKSQLEIVRGHSSKDKVVSIETLTEQEVHRRIKAEVPR